jgi:hypothetical protein
MTQVVRAVKMLKGECSADAKNEFLREADTMLNFNHKNVTTIQGVCVQQVRISLLALLERQGRPVQC